MSRKYTEKPILAASIATADDLNKELGLDAEQLNGRLDAHNLPLASISSSLLAAHTETTTSITTSVTGPTSGFHRTETRTSTITYNATNGTIVSGWNNVEADFLLSVAAQSGTIIGSAVICGKKWATDTAGVEVGADSTWELRLLANGAVIAQSGYISVGTYTVDLPFYFPCGTELVTIVAQWRILNTVTPSMGWTHPTLSIKDRLMWCRNQYR